MGSCCSQISVKNDIENTENLNRRQEEKQGNPSPVEALNSIKGTQKGNVSQTSKTSFPVVENPVKSGGEKKESNPILPIVEPEPEKINNPDPVQQIKIKEPPAITTSEVREKELTPRTAGNQKKFSSAKDIKVNQIRENLKKNI